MKTIIKIVLVLYLLFLSAPIWVSAIESKSGKNCIYAIEKSMDDTEKEGKKIDFKIDAIHHEQVYLISFLQKNKSVDIPFKIKQLPIFYSKIHLPPPNENII